VRTIPAHRKDVHGLAFAPDGRTLASVGGQSGAVWVWDVRSGDRIHKLPGRKEPGRAVAVGPGGWVAASFQRLADGDPYRVRVWRLPAEEPVAEFVVSDTHAACDLAFLSDRPELVTAVEHLRVWAIGPEKPAFRECLTYRQGIDALAVSADGGRVGFASGRSTGCWWPAANKWQTVAQVDALVHAVAFDPAGRELAVAFGHHARVFDLESCKPRIDLVGHQGMVWKVAYTPDGARLVTASSDGSVRFWDAQTATCRGSFDWQVGKVRCVAVSPDGLTVASGGQDGRIVIADVEV
jgi:WD40 repeat protein